MANTVKSIKVDIVSDVVCPWCIIGYKQLEKAIEATGVTADITWHPFELNPDMPIVGQNLREHITEKYGTSAKDSAQHRTQMIEVGRDLGFAFNFTDDMRMHNTFQTHQLLHWASIHGLQHKLKLELFSTHFTHLRNLGDPKILADAAAAVGLNRDEALAVLADGRYSKQVREHQQFWLKQGIQGVPAMVFNQKHLVTGAQGVDNYISILRQVSEQAPA